MLETMIQYSTISILFINICSLPSTHNIYHSPNEKAKSPMGYDSKWKVSTLKVVKLWLLLIQRAMNQNQIKPKDSYLFFLQIQHALVEQGQNNCNELSICKGEAAGDHWSMAILKYRWANSVKPITQCKKYSSIRYQVCSLGAVIALHGSCLHNLIISPFAIVHFGYIYREHQGIFYPWELNGRNLGALNLVMYVTVTIS